MISPNTSLRATKAFLSYQTTILIIIFIITLPLEILLFIPGIFLIALYIFFRLDYNNFSFIYNDNNIEIKQGVLSKSRKTIPYEAIQNIDISSGWLMRMFRIEQLKIWTSSPAQIQIFQNGQGGAQTQNKPDGIVYLDNEDAENLKSFLLSHKMLTK